MNKRKKRIQIIAIIGLIGIFFSIIGTGLLVIFSSNQPNITEEELEEYLKGMSGSLDNVFIEEQENFSWSLNQQESKEESFSWTGEEDLEINE